MKTEEDGEKEMTSYQRELERRAREASMNHRRSHDSIVYEADFTGFDAGEDWEPEPTNKVFDYRDGDTLEQLGALLAKYERVYKDEDDVTVYYVK